MNTVPLAELVDLVHHDRGEDLFVFTRGDEESIPYGRCGGTHAHHLGIVLYAELRCHIRPHVVIDELTGAVALDVQRSGGDQLPVRGDRKVVGQPSRLRYDAAGDLHLAQPFPLENRCIQGHCEGIPGFLFDFRDLVVPGYGVGDFRLTRHKGTSAPPLECSVHT